MKQSYSRRAFLGGAAAAVALPYLESLATGARWLGRVHAQGIPEPPKRFIAYYVPNGMHMAAFTPAASGVDYTLTPILASLEAVRDRVSVISGLANAPARPDGMGDHASGTAAFMTCAHPKKTEGSDIRNGISVDQVFANAVGAQTRFPSMQLGIDGGPSAGSCDIGYSCAYARNISWASATTPLAKITNPRTVYERLFAGFDPDASAADIERRRRLGTSVLDHARAEARGLRMRLGKSDQHKLDEYVAGVRELELRLSASDTLTCEPGARPSADYDFPTHVRLMSDLMVLALRCDLTRSLSFMLGNAGSNRAFPFIGVPDAHHAISHHQDKPENLAALQTINTWEVEQFAYLLNRLAASEENDSTLLDQSAVFFSSEIEDGNSHSHFKMPILLAGRAGGALPLGQHLVYTKDEPVADLMIALLYALDLPTTRFGDDGSRPLGGLV